MVKVILAAGIESASGKTGNVQFRTYKRANGETETRMYLLPRRKNGAFGYERKTPVSKHEMKCRSLFSKRLAFVTNFLKDNPGMTKKQAWEVAKKTIC